MTTNEIWQAVLGEVELTMSRPNFNTWFKSTYIISYEKNQVIVGVPNNFTKSWLEKKHYQTIFKLLNQLTSKGVKSVFFKVEPRSAGQALLNNPGLNSTDQGATGNSLKDFDISSLKLKGEVEEITNKYGLNPRYTFDSFVVGKGNELAHAAAQAIVAKPGLAYNPLFVYGGVGLGKTHLIQAIGNFCLKKSKNFKVLYVSSEKFTNDFINTVRSGQAKEFKERYRTVDLLLIDDIQFIGGKEGTQEEFFHTFNELHQTNKQIVLSSDRHAKAIPSLEDRLKSRLQWGMMVDISSPDFETRVAILEEKCKDKTYSLDKNILEFIATNIQSNVRELEGALNKVVAYCQFKNIPPSLTLAKSILQSVEASAKKNVTPKNLLNIVAEYYDLKMEDLIGASREKRLAFPRQVAMFLLREELKTSYPSIGQEIGNRDHTTAMHAYSKISRELNTDDKLKNDLEFLKKQLYTVK